MNSIIVAFLITTIFSVSIYAILFAFNLHLSRVMTLYELDGPGKAVVRLVAVLCLAILLLDLDWALIFMSPRLFPEMDQETRLKILLGVNFFLRLGPAVVLVLLWRQLYKRTK